MSYNKRKPVRPISQPNYTKRKYRVLKKVNHFYF